MLAFSLSGEARTRAPKNELCDSVLNLIYAYANNIDTMGLSKSSSYAYTKMQVHTNKRNATLMLVPSMFAIAHGAGRHFICEYYNKITHGGKNAFNNQRLLNVSTIPHRQSAMSPMLVYMTPNVYGEMLFENNILSPFHPSNRKFYHYRVTALPFDKAQVYAYPKLKNTQLVETKAVVDTKSGKIFMVDLDGEYDMTRFYISIVMGAGGFHSLLPINCMLKANFRFMGNNITGMLNTYYNLPKTISDSLSNASDTALMAKVRPVPLNDVERSIYQQYYDEQHKRDSISMATGKSDKGNFTKDVLWDMIGDNVLNHYKQDFGKQSQGSVRFSPILNPLYMGYNRRKGFIYKFDVRGSYSFSPNTQLAVRLRAGYSFRLHQLYLSIPATFKYNAKHEGYIETEFGKGKRINTNIIANNILGHNKDQEVSMDVTDDKYTEFTNNYFRLTNHWMFTPHIGMEVGIMAHHRKAIHPDFYLSYGYPSVYRSVAPTIGIKWLPSGKKDIVVTADYEQSISGFCGSNIPYSRIETDAKCIFYNQRRQSYFMRLGSGFYLTKGQHWYFIDYSNFSDDYMPGGWDDEWSGSFELLRSVWYNTSDYYVRGNFTYETPILLAAWLPLAGRYIEAERLYVNALAVKHLYPYTEWGYGFSTRLFSLGVFVAFRKAKYDGFGCRFAFELFRNW